MGTAEQLALDADTFRSLLRGRADSVTVVTAAGDPPAGFTATSFTSVSLCPPMVLFCLHRSASCWRPVVLADYVGVNLLAEGQREAARTFAARGIDRFAHHGAWHEGPYGVPILDHVAAWLVGRVVNRMPAGDHTIVVAEAVVGGHGDERTPLLYHDGDYTAVRPPD